MTNTPATVVFTANRGYALLSSRSSLIRRFIDSGWKVVIATADDDESRRLEKYGVTLAPVTFNRGGLALAADRRAYARLVKIYQEFQPSLIQHLHAKPVILGTKAARRVLGNSVKIVNTITGLGHAFIKGGLAAKLAGLGYKLALPRSDLTIFQNQDDWSLFRRRGWVSAERSRLIASSGVDTARFLPVSRSDRDDNAPVIVMLGRLLRQKGVPEFLEVARRVRRRWPKARFLLAGEEDSVHPDSVRADWVKSQQQIEFHGRLQDVLPVLHDADMFLFPSYREGVPRAVLEAASTGLPTVGFDVPGVREVVKNGKTGWLAPFGNVDKLTDCVTSLLEDKSMRLRMGSEARKMVEQSFDVRTIEQQYVDAYVELGLVVK